MYGGKVKCCGSTMFLKRLYHVGYLLRLELTKDIKEVDLLNLIREYIPDAIYEKRNVNEHFIRLVLNEQNSKKSNLNLLIANLFDSFEQPEIKQNFAIQSYALTNTCLEDVFIKIGTLDQKNNENAIEVTENVEDHPLHNLERIQGLALYSQQFTAIFVKKFKLIIKNLQMFISSFYLLLIPLFLVLLLSVFVRTLPKNAEIFIESFNLKRNLDSNNRVLLLSDNFSEPSLFRKENQDWFTKEFGLKFIQSTHSNLKEALQEERNRADDNELDDQFLLVPVRLSPTNYQFHMSRKQFPIDFGGLLECFYRAIARDSNHTEDFNVNLGFELLEMKELETSIEDKSLNEFDKLTQYAISLFTSYLFSAILITVMFSFPYVVFIELPHDEINSGSLSMQIIAGLSKTLYWIGNLLFDFLFTVLIILLSGILIYSFDYYSIVRPYIGEIILTFTLASFNIILITYFIINVNLKKELSETILKYFILITGLSICIYDSIVSVRNILAPNISTNAFDKLIVKKSEKSNPAYSFALKILSPVYNFAELFFEYQNRYAANHCEKLIKSPVCEMIRTRDFDLKMNLLAFSISIVIVISLIIFINYNSALVQRLLESVKLTLFQRSNQQQLRTNEQQLLNPTTSSPREQADIVEVNYLSNIQDPNIDKEKQLAQMLIETNNLQSNIVVVHDLYKLYGSLEAVNHLSFTVKRGECFALLGINGAGKSTTFDMIAGSQMPTSGSIILDGFTFSSDPYEYFRRLGYCPQVNTHTSHISVSDNLRFYARINGLPSNLIDKAVRTLIDECDLKEQKFKFAENLSGGNKRKLSTAISLIGKKDLILLDEPTTGVDPVARRKLLKTIEFYKKDLKTSFILTSHSMDEVEKLCSRISIMVAGKFKAIGTFNYLKEKYSQGFTITIRIKNNLKLKDYIKSLKDRMHQDFNGQATLKEFYMNSMVYIILSKSFNWSHLFRLMEKIKTEFQLEDFLISETNLEQIFLSFANSKN